MKLLRQLLIILAICFAGELIHKFAHIPVPGNVIGMIVLFLCLHTGIIKLEMIDEISKFLLDHLAFFFLPAGVGLIACLEVFKANWIPFLVICFIITVLVMVITGYTVQFFIKRSRSK